MTANDMSRVAVLVDGGYFLHEAFSRLGGRLATAEELVSAARSTLKPTERLFRIYYYDRPPILGQRANPVSREVHDLSNSHAARERTSLQDRLEIADFVAFRRGRLAFSGWTISRAAFRELLQTGRSFLADDLRPAVTQKGVHVALATVGGNCSTHLLAHSDEHRRIRI